MTSGRLFSDGSPKRAKTAVANRLKRNELRVSGRTGAIGMRALMSVEGGDYGYLEGMAEKAGVEVVGVEAP